MQIKVNTSALIYFWVYSGATPVTGLTASNFNKLVLFNGAIVSNPVSIFEVSSTSAPGLYRAVLVPDSVGYWFFSAQHASYTTSPTPASQSLEVIAVDLNDIYELILHTPPGGEILITTDYGGTDNLRYVDLHGSGIGGAEVRAYLKDDYTNNRVGNIYIKSSTRTDTNGRLVAPMTLSPTSIITLFICSGGESRMLKRFMSVRFKGEVICR